MQIVVRDSNLRRLTALNNKVQGMLSFMNDTWHRYLAEATSTFDLTIPKFYNGKLHDDLIYITDRVYLSFRYQGENYLFYIAQMIEDDFQIQLTCNNTSLELVNELANPFTSSEAHTMDWYIKQMELMVYDGGEIGVFEISDTKRTLTFENQETKLARLLSLASHFDAEIKFTTELNRDGSYKRMVLNIYHKADDTHHGVGRIRSDVILRYGKDVKGVQVTTDKTDLFTMGVFTGADGVNLNGLERSDKDELGNEEFYTRKGTSEVYAPKAAQLYGSGVASLTDKWIRRDYQTEYTNANDLLAYAFRTLKQYAYPKMTYTATIQSNFVNSYSDLALGDTVKIQDENFVNGLILQARVSEQVISFSNPNNNTLTFSNYVKLKSQLSSSLSARMQEMIDKKVPYTIQVATTNGTAFKNNTGESVITPTLKKGDKVITADVTYRFSLDGNVVTGGFYVAQGSEVEDTTILTIAAYVGNDEVAVDEVTLVNVNDGVNGQKGEKGEKGDRGPKGDKGDRGAQGERGPQGPQGAQGIQGLQGPKGDQGIAGAKGADGRTQYTHIAYADNATGGGFSQTDQTKAYIGMYQDFNATDSNNPTAYRWTKWRGSDGAQGVPGKAGADGKTPYIHFAYAESADGRTGFSTSQTGNKRYIGTYTDFTQADSTDPTKYKWVDMVGTVKIGSRNYAEDYDFSRGLWEYSQGDNSPQKWNTNNGIYTLTTTTTTWHQFQIFTESGTRLGGKRDSTALLEPRVGEIFTLSVEVKSNSGNPNFWLEVRDNGLKNHDTMVIQLGDRNLRATGEWVRYSITGVWKPTPDFGHRRIILGYNEVGSISFRKVELTQSNIFTDAGRAPEDIQADIDTKADQTLTQEQINALNERAGLIQAEMEAKAAMDTVTKWFAEYQQFVEDQKAGMQRSNNDIVTLSQRVNAIDTNLGSMAQRWSFIDSYMKAGNEGLVIGKNDGSSSVRISDKRISFCSAGQEVAYITNGVLQIDNGVFTKTLQIGRFREEQYHSNLDMNVMRYVGG